MMSSTKSKQLSQADKFREAARQLETDDDETRFEEKLRGIVRQKPEAKKGQEDAD